VPAKIVPTATEVSERQAVQDVTGQGICHRSRPAVPQKTTGESPLPSARALIAHACALVGEPLEQLMPVARAVHPRSGMLTSHAVKLPGPPLIGFFALGDPERRSRGSGAASASPWQDLHRRIWATSENKDRANAAASERRSQLTGRYFSSGPAGAGSDSVECRQGRPSRR
jgi:hypothetical protein